MKIIKKLFNKLTIELSDKIYKLKFWLDDNKIHNKLIDNILINLSFKLANTYWV